MQSEDVSLAFSSSNLLGEGPVWNEKRGSLLWIDIDSQLLFEMKWPQKEFYVWEMPQLLGMLALESDSNVIVALQDGLARFNLENSELKWLINIEKGMDFNRPNDGKCDAKGRLWLGTMNINCQNNTGSLYLIDENLSLTQILTKLTISNGLCWSADNKYLYFIDSATYKVDSYLFDLDKGKIEFAKTVLNVPAYMGMPDGMSIDEEGMLWIAHWGGFAVRRWNPQTGGLLYTILLPVPQVTSVTFGGKNLDELFITTAKTGLTEDQLATYEMSGNVFTVKLPIKGLLPNHFKCN